MRGSTWTRPWQLACKLGGRGRALGQDERGATAVEFALVAAPFFMLLFGIMSVGFYFFVVFSLENAVETASRVIRTGQAQTQTPNAMTVAEFKTRVCDSLPAFMSCSNNSSSKIRIHVQNFTAYNGITAPTCVDNVTGNMAAGQTYTPGGASAIVLVTVCYEWDISQAMAGMSYWIMPPGTHLANNSTLIMASTTFTTEPYQ